MISLSVFFKLFYKCSKCNFINSFLFVADLPIGADFNQTRAADYKRRPESEKLALAESAKRIRERTADPSTYTPQERLRKIAKEKKALQATVSTL